MTNKIELNEEDLSKASGGYFSTCGQIDIEGYNGGVCPTCGASLSLHSSKFSRDGSVCSSLYKCNGTNIHYVQSVRQNDVITWYYVIQK